MKRIFIILITLLCTAKVEAQTSQEILRKMSSAISQLGAYSANFIMSSAEGDNNGSLTVNDKLFCIKAGIIELRYDGNTIYEIDHSTKEIIIEELSDDNSFWSNPAQAFTMLDSQFEHKLESSDNINGKTLYRILLTAHTQDSEGFTLWVDTTTYLPYKAVYGIGEHSVSIRFIRIESTPTPDDNLFVFDQTKYTDYEQIDMR